MIFKRIFIALFFLIITISFLDIFISVLPQNKNTENVRELQKPKLDKISASSFVKFSSDLFRYYSHIDRDFNGRSFLINQFINLKINILKSHKPIPQVVMGSDNWIYLGKNKYANVTFDYLNAQEFTTEELNTIGKNFDDNYQYLKNKNISYFVSVVPNTQTIYPEYFPQFLVKKGKFSRLQQLNHFLSSIHSPVSIIDLTDALIKQKGDTLLYYKTDTHWNMYGSYFGYLELMKNMQHQFPEIPIIPRDNLDIQLKYCPGGDNAKMLDKADFYQDIKADVTIRNADETYLFIDSTYISKSIAMYYFRIKNSKKKLKVLYFRDSCTGNLTDYLSQSFGESVFFWETVLIKRIIEREKPDIVMQIVVERDLGRIFLQPMLEDRIEH